jgi:hypothetical protein
MIAAQRLQQLIADVHNLQGDIGTSRGGAGSHIDYVTARNLESARELARIREN